MAVQKIAISVHRYTGLASEVSGLTGVPPGSTFLATDTQALYITYDGTNWVLKDPFGEVKASPTANTLLARLKDLFTDGTYTIPTHSTATIGIASGEVLASNANRLYALLINDSDTAIYIKLGAAAVLNQGIRLSVWGGSYEISKKLGNLYTGAINGICASGSKILLVTEGV